MVHCLVTVGARSFWRTPGPLCLTVLYPYYGPLFGYRWRKGILENPRPLVFDCTSPILWHCTVFDHQLWSVDGGEERLYVDWNITAAFWCLFLFPLKFTGNHFDTKIDIFHITFSNNDHFKVTLPATRQFATVQYSVEHLRALLHHSCFYCPVALACSITLHHGAVPRSLCVLLAAIRCDT